MGKQDLQAFFTNSLLEWNQFSNNRDMPWKHEKDPYKIWLSEIILQQTRVEQGTSYYNRFIARYPDIIKLAEAPDTAVFKLWEGLGYYSRCKNLLATARFISKHYNGRFPSVYHEILALKGVGPYTAAAIASFAFGLPHAVVDGNVIRVLARYFGIGVVSDSTEGRKLFTHLANVLLDKKNAGIYNQAIMDFGATICKPQQPLCENCVMASSCIAYNQNKMAAFPVKGKKLLKKDRWFYYLVIRVKNSIYVRKRTGRDIWQNLHEFVLIEADQPLTLSQLKKNRVFKLLGNKAVVNHVSEMQRQQLTHQNIFGQFVHIGLQEKIYIEGYELIRINKIPELAFPRMVTGYFTEAPGYF